MTIPVTLCTVWPNRGDWKAGPWMSVMLTDIATRTAANNCRAAITESTIIPTRASSFTSAMLICYFPRQTTWCAGPGNVEGQYFRNEPYIMSDRPAQSVPHASRLRIQRATVKSVWQDELWYSQGVILTTGIAEYSRWANLLLGTDDPFPPYQVCI